MNSNQINDILNLYSKTVYRLALAHVKTTHDADDVFQDVFLRLISKPRTFESEEHRKAWLIRVTINRCKSLKTSSWFKKTEPLDNIDETAVYEIKMAETETDISAYLSALPHKQRTAMYLFYCEGYSTKEIAEIMKTKDSTVRSWLMRARAKLRIELKGVCVYE